MRKVRKGFSGVDTSLFDGMLVPQQVQDDVADAAEDEDVSNEISAKPTPQSPTPATTPPPQQELIPSSSQVESTLPPSPHQSLIVQQSSPPPQQPHSHDAEISMALLNQLLETCATLSKQVVNLEQDKIAQAIEITTLKQRVGRLEKKKKLKASGLKRLRKVRTAQRVESSADIVMDDQEDASKQGGGIADANMDVTLEEVHAEKDVEVIEFGDSYEVPKDGAATGSASDGKKGRNVAVTTEDMQKRRNDVKARTTLLLALPDEHQLRLANTRWLKNSKNISGNGEVNTAELMVASAEEFALLIDEDDIEEMDIKWNMAFLSMRADRYWKKTRKKISI
nr:hypothetical protein [Tanacetum cinerariifolium]